MTNTCTLEILSKEDLGDVTKIEIEIKSKDICSINDVGCPQDLYEGDHESLHTNNVEHNHNRLTINRTLFFDNPFSQEYFDNYIDSVLQSVNGLSYDEDFRPDKPDVLERQYTNGGHEKIFYYVHNMPQDLVSQFETAFPDIDIATHYAVSTPVYHELFGEDIISTFTWGSTDLEDNGQKLIMKSRKYCMTSKKYYDRCYKVSEESFDFLPPEATTLAVGYNTNAQDGLELPDFFDVYFSCDPTIAETFFELDSLQGEHVTYYAATVVDGVVVRAKQYCYDEATFFSNWVETVETHKASNEANNGA